MNYFFKYSILFVSAYCSMANAAEKLFDLHNQYLYETMPHTKAATGIIVKADKPLPKVLEYDFPKVFFSTNSKYDKKLKRFYANKNNENGTFMKLSLKEPLAQWSYIEDRMSYGGNNRLKGPETVIRFTSDTSKTFHITMYVNQITINNEKIKLPMNTRMGYMTDVKYHDATFSIIINGNTVKTANLPNFGNLSQIETTIPLYGESSDNIQQMELYAR